MKGKQVKLRKIHLDTLIKVLVELYDKGVDYVDVIGTTDDVQDSIGLSFCSEYMNKDMRDNFDKISASEINNKEDKAASLDEEDLNQLI
jgi:hypothetical protein